MISTLLNELSAKEDLEEVYTGKYKLKSKGGYVVGVVEMKSNGSAYIVSEEFPQDIFINEANLNHALNGDIVKVYCYAHAPFKNPEGEVVEILKRSRETFVGTVEVSSKLCLSDYRKPHLPYDLFIPLKDLKGAQSGDKGIARITNGLKM
jgi:ribonuclease R